MLRVWEFSVCCMDSICETIYPEANAFVDTHGLSRGKVHVHSGGGVIYYPFIVASLHGSLPPSIIHKRLSPHERLFSPGIIVFNPLFPCYARGLHVILRPASFYCFPLTSAEVAGDAHK